MLIDKKNMVEVNDIVSMKLNSGEEVVGKLVEKSIDSVYLAKPVRVIMEPTKTGQIGLSMLPILGSVNDVNSVQFPLSALTIKPLKTGDEVKRNYLQMTTGIMSPSPQQTDFLS